MSQIHISQSFDEPNSNLRPSPSFPFHFIPFHSPSFNDAYFHHIRRKLANTRKQSVELPFEKRQLFPIPSNPPREKTIKTSEPTERLRITSRFYVEC